jgi:hypothetical protein
MTPDPSTMAGSSPATDSMVTMSPESTVNTGFNVALKYPTCTVCGLGISVCSAPDAPDNASTDKSKL